MTLTIQMLIRPAQVPVWQPHLEAAFSDLGLVARFGQDFDPASVDYVVYAPSGPVDLSPYTRTKAVLGLWAGVESIISNETLTQPYARMVDIGLTQGMIDYVTGHVLRYHLDIDRYITRTGADWTQVVPPLASDRRVTVLGLGELGAACASALTRLGFQVSGWSRSEKTVAGVTCHHGEDGLAAALDGAEIVVLLLPATPATESILDASAMARLAPGAKIINPGRGGLIDDDALLAALDGGQVGHATLDTFRVEPLPEDHPYWRHPKVTVTPHIASETRPDTASRMVAENVRRVEAGEPLLNEVDKARGY